MLDFDFKPVEEELSPKGGDKRLKWGTILIVVLTILSIIFAYLYINTLQKLEEANNRIAELESNMSPPSFADSSEKFEFSPEILIYKGKIKKVAMFEDRWGRNYVMPDGSVIADWELEIRGDTVLLRYKPNPDSVYLMNINSIY